MCCSQGEASVLLEDDDITGQYLTFWTLNLAAVSTNSPSVNTNTDMTVIFVRWQSKADVADSENEKQTQ